MEISLDGDSHTDKFFESLKKGFSLSTGSRIGRPFLKDRSHTRIGTEESIYRQVKVKQVLMGDDQRNQ